MTLTGKCVADPCVRVVAIGASNMELYDMGYPQATAEMYNTNTDSWGTFEPLRTNGQWFGGTSAPAAAAILSRIFIAGGSNNADGSAKALDTTDGAVWRTIEPMTAPRWNQAAVAVGASVYMIGGECTSNECPTQGYLSSCEVYSMESDTWNAIAPMATTRSYPAAAVVGTRIFVTGGLFCGNSCGGVSVASSVEVYDTTSGTWTAMADMSSDRAYHAAVAVGTRIYVMGGQDNNDNVLRSAEVYDTETSVWGRIQPMGTARYQVAAAAIRTRIYVAGGSDGPVFASAEMYDTDSGVWSDIAPMDAARHNHNMVAVRVCGPCEDGWAGELCNEWTLPTPRGVTQALYDTDPNLDIFLQAQPEISGRTWVQCFDSSTDDASTPRAAFHPQCNQYDVTLTIASNSLGYTFGGYVSCMSCMSCLW